VKIFTTAPAQVKAVLNGERRLECFRQRILAVPAAAQDKAVTPIRGAQQVQERITA